MWGDQEGCVAIDRWPAVNFVHGEIGPPQSKSAPESKLSYPADTSTGVYVVDLGLHILSPTPIFTRRNC